MKAVFGYLSAGIGLLGLAINSVAGREMVGFLDNISSEYILIPAAILIVLGVAIMVMNSKGGKIIKHITEEVPIYRGEGKKRKIVGYRAD